MIDEESELKPKLRLNSISRTPAPGIYVLNVQVIITVFPACGLEDGLITFNIVNTSAHETIVLSACCLSSVSDLKFLWSAVKYLNVWGTLQFSTQVNGKVYKAKHLVKFLILERKVYSYM